LEVAFIISENEDVLYLMGKTGELLNGGTSVSSQFYYGCLFKELLSFQFPGRHPISQVFIFVFGYLYWHSKM
jgi:methionine S-methyltransferase